MGSGLTMGRKPPGGGGLSIKPLNGGTGGSLLTVPNKGGTGTTIRKD